MAGHGATLIDDRRLTAFRAQFKGDIVLPADAGYDAALVGAAVAAILFSVIGMCADTAPGSGHRYR